MENFTFMKLLFDAEQEDFTLEEVQELSQLSEDDTLSQLKSLSEEKLIKKENDRYSITQDGRVDFANTYSKRVMIRLLLFSGFMTVLLYVLAKLLT